MEWYKSLTIEQKINLKDCCALITGMTWEELSILFSFREKIRLIHKKLQLEEFEV